MELPRGAQWDCRAGRNIRVGVEIRSDRVDITLSRGRLTQLLAGSIDLKMQHQAPTSAPDELLGLTVPVSLKRVGREMRMLVENANDQTAADPRRLDASINATLLRG
jgi:site-specific DNA recombinase